MKSKNMTCLQYCINGMNEGIFDFASSEGGRSLVEAFKKLLFVRENQIKELLIAYNSYFMIHAAMQVSGQPKTQKAVIEFMDSRAFNKLQKELIRTIDENYPMLLSLLSPDQRQRLDRLFE